MILTRFVNAVLTLVFLVAAASEVRLAHNSSTSTATLLWIFAFPLICLAAGSARAVFRAPAESARK